MDESRTPLPGSHRSALPHLAPLGPVDPNARAEVTVVLRRPADLPADIGVAAPVSREEFAARFGANPADVAAVRGAVEAAGADVVDVDAASRRMRVGGSTEVLAQLFGTALHSAQSRRSGATVDHRYREGELSVPASLDGIVTAVLGLDERPQAEPRYRRAGAAPTSYTPVQLAKIYNLPEGTDGSGQTLAIIELGGGFAQSDLTTYFGGLGIPVPSVTAVGVDGAENKPGADPDGADGEVLLDIEVAGGIAPGATQLVYFAPNTDAGFLDAIATATHADPTPTAISISWGASEDTWTGQARTAMDEAFADAAALGVTVTAAAGDNGSSDAQTGGGSHVDFPAASPHVLACGGTNLQADGTSGAIRSETVWNNGGSRGATGGGVSDTFALPDWQAAVGVPARKGTSKHGRGVPDVAGAADPETGYEVFVDGQATVIGGTSAVSPLWAGLVCRLAQALGAKVGLLQPALYAGVAAAQPATAFHDVTVGDNGAYAAQPGWDACTGLGSPDGAALLTLLQSRQA